MKLNKETQTHNNGPCVDADSNKPTVKRLLSQLGKLNIYSELDGLKELLVIY